MLNEEELWALIGFIKVSQTRYATLKALENEFLMPSEIARKTDIRVTQISNALHDMKERNLVECKNEEASKGRIYQNTELGSTILKILEK